MLPPVTANGHPHLLATPKLPAWGAGAEEVLVVPVTPSPEPVFMAVGAVEEEAAASQVKFRVLLPSCLALIPIRCLLALGEPLG